MFTVQTNTDLMYSDNRSKIGLVLKHKAICSWKRESASVFKLCLSTEKNSTEREVQSV
jgi:hypothetical protein